MKLLCKEITLAAHPTLFLFILFGALVLVPSYPYSMVFFFGCLGPYFTCTYARETNDLWYTALLPVTKAQVAVGKLTLTAAAQLSQLALTLPWALLRHALGAANNPVGLDPTAAWFGFGLMAYAAFDLVFFPVWFGSGFRTGRAFLLALPPLLAVMGAAELSFRLPGLSFLDSSAPADLLRQLPVTAFGALLFVAALALTRQLSVRRFRRVDL
ncbi:ABC-2 transporter permease [Flavonifractor sp. An91]|uniref:ABC-2 transporter permease n=1 Tax=Flavonifractor sp. An91 TaxID=1965665 RepID=UPI000B391DBE|nr:ABC-2 transporter permease [Flavonifractor sp. An91]OUN14288.1 hypothetical protein B5G42_02155 [Flavonifractor sp. An91]